MKKYIGFIAILLMLSTVLIACNDDNENEIGNTEQNEANENRNENAGGTDNNSAGEEPSNIDDHQADEGPSNNNDGSDNQSDEKGDALAAYSAEEIEYARVWLQVGENQDIDKLYVKQILAGEPLNPDDEKSVDYQEDVVQLTGTRLVDGTVTYSSNGDGTINVYDVPNRWDGKNMMEDVYKQIINNTEEVVININNDEKVEALIKKIEME